MIEENGKCQSAEILKFYIKPDSHFCGRWCQISKPRENEQPPHQPHPSVKNKVQRRYCLLTPPYGNRSLMTSDTGLLGSLQMVRDKDKAERKRKAEMARLRREKIMAQMSEMQKHFINENKELFQQSLEELEASTSAAACAR